MARSQQASIVYFLSVGIRNAAWLLCGYWTMAIFAELISKHWPLPLVLGVLEHFPEKVLKVLGLWGLVKGAYFAGELSVVEVRFVYGLSVVVGFVALSVGVGVCLWLLQRILRFWASRY